MFAVLVGAPFCGTVTAFIACVISFGVSGYEADFEFCMSYAIAIGAPTAAALALPTTWFLLEEDWGESLMCLVLGTLCVALPLAFIPEFGAVLSWLGGVVGFWIGFVCAKKHLLEGLWKRLVREWHGE